MSSISVRNFLLSVLWSAAVAAAQKAPPALENDPQSYRIGPGDVLQVEVWKEPEASAGAVTVRPDGSISLPMIGEVRAAGLRTTELEKHLDQKYGEMIREARVTVFVREVNSQRVYIIGEVRREGPIRMVGPITVLQALAEAGGLTDYAKRKKIYILRIVGERRLILPFDYDAVVRGAMLNQNIALLPGDTVVVPR